MQQTETEQTGGHSMLSIFGILLALSLLIWLSYKGGSVLLLAPALALLAAVISGAPSLAAYTQIFMRALADFVMLFFPVFLLGAVFGKLMDASGNAASIAKAAIAVFGPKNAMFAVIAACAVLTYGGVSLFVVAFAVYPIAASLFQLADIPKRLIPGAIALGAFTFTMTALPGSPAIQNIIPMPYFGTTAFAAPVLGMIAGVVMIVFGVSWLAMRARRAQSLSEGYGDISGETGTTAASHETPVLYALIPIAVVVVLNFYLSHSVFPKTDAAYLATPLYGAVNLSSVIGLWSIITALTAGTLVLGVLCRRNLPDLATNLTDGAGDSVLPILNTASLVGFGAVVASLSGFEQIRDGILGIAPGNPLISLSIAINALAGITGSASGGMSIALKTLGDTYLEIGAASGISPDLMHRVSSVATGGLDALPHNGAVVTLLSICGLTHQQSYFDIFVVAVIGPLFALAVIIALGTMFGSF